MSPCASNVGGLSTLHYGFCRWYFASGGVVSGKSEMSDAYPRINCHSLDSLCTLGCLSNPAQEAHRGRVVPRNANLRERGRCSSVRLQFFLELLEWAAHRSPRLLRFCRLPFPCFIRRHILLLQFVVSFFGISSIAA